MSSPRRVNPDSLAVPVGFAHAVVGSGPVVLLAGQTGMRPDGSIVAGGIVAQFEQALANLLTALGEAGGSPADLAALTIYLVDVDDYRAHAGQVGAVWRRLVGSDYPAMAAVGVTRLWDREALVELQGIALPPSPTG